VAKGGPPAGQGSAGRVVAGSARGLRLVAPEGAVRPLGDRLKQALFAILEPQLREGTFLDLFAGSGAAGIEALSRGARVVTFVESDDAALVAIEHNLASTRLAGDRARVVRAGVPAWLATHGRAGGAFDVVFADPPYGEPGLLVATIEAIQAAGAGGILARDGVLVSKHDRRTGPPARMGLLASVRERRFGESGLTFHRWLDEGDTGSEVTG
jgi:16S rRNA (guanine(966)-N(2))-methyltransferase RsmD